MTLVRSLISDQWSVDNEEKVQMMTDQTIINYATSWLDDICGSQVAINLFQNLNIKLIKMTMMSVVMNALKSGEGFCPSCFHTPEWYSITISINHLFLTINRSNIKTIPVNWTNFLCFVFGTRLGHCCFDSSSINFLIYCSVGDRFKKVVFK